jgi:hypothetical protein
MKHTSYCLVFLFLASFCYGMDNVEHDVAQGFALLNQQEIAAENQKYSDIMRVFKMKTYCNKRLRKHYQLVLQSRESESSCKKQLLFEKTDQKTE